MRLLAVFTVLLAVVAFGQEGPPQQQPAAAPKEPPKPPVGYVADRSGEARLKALFVTWGTVRGVHITGNRSGRREEGYLVGNAPVDLYVAKDGRFRYESSSGAGSHIFIGRPDGCYYERFGTSLTILDPVPSLDKALALDVIIDSSMVPMQLLGGISTFDRTVLKEWSITLTKGSGMDQVEYKNPKGLVVRLYLRGDEVVRAETWPEYAQTGVPLSVERYVVDRDPRFPPWLFEPMSTNGLKVEDKRKKGGRMLPRTKQARDGGLARTPSPGSAG